MARSISKSHPTTGILFIFIVALVLAVFLVVNKIREEDQKQVFKAQAKTQVAENTYTKNITLDISGQPTPTIQTDSKLSPTNMPASTSQRPPTLTPTLTDIIVVLSITPIDKLTNTPMPTNKPTSTTAPKPTRASTLTPSFTDKPTPTKKNLKNSSPTQTELTELPEAGYLNYSLAILALASLIIVVSILI